MAVKLIAPWMELYHEIEAFFLHDPYVHVVLHEDEYTVDLFVDNAAKADALALMMPAMVKFGDIKFYINIIPANDNYEESCGDIYYDAFASNEAFSFARTISGIMSNPITYVVFRNTVVQYYNDDLGDIYGQRSCLYEDIARDIFGDADGVYFCTDLPSNEDEKMTRSWP